MFTRVFKFFANDLSDQEAHKFSLLSIALFFTVGAYWLLKTLKDGFFFNIVGGEFQPYAKMLSLTVISVLVLVYSKLVDMFHSYQLFYILGSFYAIFFIFFTICISFPFGDPNSIYFSFIKILAWISYALIESFGSIMIALFWSFVASTTDAASAKRGYFLIIAGAQLGAISGPFLAWNAKALGLPLLFSIAVLCIFALMLVIRKFMLVIPKNEIIGENQNLIPKKKTGFFGGLKLVITRPYLFGLFLLVVFYEIVTTIVSYQMKMQAQTLPQYSTREGLTSFMGIFGMSTNLLAFVIALFGTGYLIKKFGIRISLLVFPSVIGVVMAVSYGFIRLDILSPYHMLWLTFSAVVIAKGLSYALNNPAKEVMYIPTSNDVKFKAKGWIDMFGARGAKVMGSGFNAFLKRSPVVLFHYGTILSLGIVGIWIVIALLVGNKFHKLVKENKIVK